MEDVKNNLIDVLSSFGYPVRLQGSLTESEKYPDSFFTIWNDDTSGGSFYDNDAIDFIWEYSVYFYSVDPALVNTVLLSVREQLKANGWIVIGKGYDVPTDQPSHTGRAFDVLFLEQN